MQAQSRRTRQQRGQAIVLIALMAVALVAFVGLALDGAQVFENRRWMQNGADAGAMAGAKELGSQAPRADIAAKIAAYTVGSGGIGNNADVWEAVFMPSGNNVKTTNPAATDNCVKVSTFVTFPTYFIGVIGFDTLNTVAYATACTGPIVATSTPLWPVVIMTPTAPWTYDAPVELFFDSSTTDYLPGSFAWIDFNGSENVPGELDQWLINTFVGNYAIHNYDLGPGMCNSAMVLPKPSVLTLGDCVEASTGVQFQPHLAEISSKLGQEVTVLIADDGNNSGRKLYHIVAFARFRLESVNSQGSNSSLIGRFRKFVLPGEICVTNCGSVTSGIKGVNLTR